MKTSQGDRNINQQALGLRGCLKKLAWRLKSQLQEQNLPPQVAESPKFFLVHDGGLCSYSRGFNRQTLLIYPLMQHKLSSAMGRFRSRFRWAMPTLLMGSNCKKFSPNQHPQPDHISRGSNRSVARGITAKRWLKFWTAAVIIWSGGATLTGCAPPMSDSSTLNSRYTDEQPSLSGNGQFLAFLSSRDGANQVLLYDLKARTFVALPGLNSLTMIAQNPSLSRNARYIAYLGNNQGKLDIFVYDRLTQRPEIVTLGYKNLIRRPALSPDGRYLVFETDRRGQWDIEVIDRGTGIELDKPEG
jgi:hypothetical protein